MKQLLITIAAVVLVGCGKSQQSATAPEAEPVDRVEVAKAPNNLIHKAAEEGNIEAVKQHLAAGWDVNAKDKDGWTPLQHAVFSKEVVELLIANGADVNVQDNDGWTLLHFGRDNFVPVAELLIENGAKIDAKTNDGSTPLFNAILLGENKFARLLIEKGADVRGIPLIHAKSSEIIKILIDGGADVNYAPENGITALGSAVIREDKESAKLLISNGANVNAIDREGSTPLDYAIIDKQYEIADLLRKHGAKTGEEFKAEGK